MIVPTYDGRRAHGLETITLLEAIVAKQQADFDLAREMGKLPAWYLARLEVLEALGSNKSWSDDTPEACGLAVSRATNPDTCCRPRKARRFAILRFFKSAGRTLCNLGQSRA